MGQGEGHIGSWDARSRHQSPRAAATAEHLIYPSTPLPLRSVSWGSRKLISAFLSSYRPPRRPSLVHTSRALQLKGQRSDLLLLATVARQSGATRTGLRECAASRKDSGSSACRCLQPRPGVPPNPEAPDFPSCLRPVRPHLKSSSRQSGPRSLTIQGPPPTRQPATQLLSGCVPADSHAPPLYVRPPPHAHARPYTLRVTAGPAPACCPAPLPRACHVGPPANSVVTLANLVLQLCASPARILALSSFIHPSLMNSILDSRRPCRLRYSLETSHLSFLAPFVGNSQRDLPSCRS